MRRIFILAALVGWAAVAPFALRASAQAPMPLSTSAHRMGTEERFQELFMTSVYSTAFGAALGAAVLGFTRKPTANLRFITIGASSGFIVGSLVGVYAAFNTTGWPAPASSTPYGAPRSNFPSRTLPSAPDQGWGVSQAPLQVSPWIAEGYGLQAHWRF